jgi:hypothetical protein
VLLVSAALFLAYYLPVGLPIGYTILYWMLDSSSVTVAQPVADNTSAAVMANLPVPRLIHQTWRTAEVPSKWKAAQQSCIDAHPGYQYKLWTDKNALQVP